MPFEQAKAYTTNRFRHFLTLVLILAAFGAARAQDTVTQTFTLHPGWNAIWLEVLPTNTAVSAVFAGVPIESVWTFQTRLSAVDFIQDPNQPVWNRDRWQVYVPTNQVESFQNNLVNIQVNRAYLVKLQGINNVPLAVAGRPSLRVPEWVPNAYNLRGFPIDPAGSAPTFLKFFQPSAAHCDAATGILQKIYRLSSAGQWRLVAPTDLMRAGEACWVYTQGASEYQGPLSVHLDFGDALDYGYGADRLSLTFQNQAAGPVTVTLSSLGATAPLSYYNLDLVAGVQWIPLPSPQAMVLAAAEKRSLRLAARRPDMTDESFASVLAVGDGAGARYLVPVNISKVTTATLASQPASPAPRGLQAGASSEESHVGLWVGTATINAVSEAHGGVLVTNLLASVNGVSTPVEYDPGLALRFDGVSDSVDFGNVPAAGDLTIEMWVNPAVAANQCLLDKSYYGEGRIQLSADQQAVFYFGSDINHTNFLESGAPIPAGVWTHLAFVRDFAGRQLRCYVNGINTSSKTLTLTSAAATSNPLQLGSGPSGPFQGQVDELRIWSYARSPEDLARCMRTTLSGREAGLAGYWTFDQAAGPALDATVHGRDGTVQGASHVPSTAWSVTPGAIRALWTGVGSSRVIQAWNNATPVPVFSRVERIGAGAIPTPTKNEFNLRLIIHVDPEGNARLLKEVIQMWKDGTYTNAPDGWRVMEKAGNYVLVTDETLIPQFRGAAVVDGQEVGRRISTVDFDFPSTPASNFLPLDGSFAVNQTLAGSILLSPDFPTNPFRHKYHPDHGSGYAITRALELTFFPTNVTGAAQTSYGYDVMGGAYRETVGGLHKSNIVATGTFTLNRVAVTPYLNQ